MESLVILPAHLSGNLVRSRARLWTVIGDKRRHFDRWLTWVITTPYRKLQHRAQSRRYLTVAVALSNVMPCGGLVGGGFLRFSFLLTLEDNEVVVSLTMNPGTSVEETGRWAEQILKVGVDLMSEYDSLRTDGRSNLWHQAVMVGRTMDDGPEDESGEGSNLAQVTYFLIPPEERD